MNAEKALPLLVIAVVIFALARYQGLKIWVAGIVLAAGIWIGLDPLTGPPVSDFLSRVSNGRFP